MADITPEQALWKVFLEVSDAAEQGYPEIILRHTAMERLAALGFTLVRKE